ncbi:alpha/beta fold hydrolase [Ichthyenterobacterium sp. W332]|uniref:Alpha/beta fold hydrolase n=1 Tax=Microcosmobacter mediterraneus TaxID=3075607 RepID=A0ABU2YLH2_9FLAO|nr:alpha/beta fold hydrolase [Ichthyenterobacterium sp. W332]MDT0558761.1 alpha/beta fold hydrolase [Ichthyenterobacterium sp. W332]
MPILESTYKPKFYLKNGNLSTVYSGLVRKVKGVVQQRERIDTKDGDFLDLDWSYAITKSDAVIILLHGLEGHGQRPYLTGTAKLFNGNEIDAVCVNFRGCSGEDNKFYHSYHSGATEDLDDVIQHCITNKGYSKIYIKGISLGANITLKYLGETRDIPKEVKAGIAISVPCDLIGSSKELHKLKNLPYAINFRQHLVKKLVKKLDHFPDQINKEAIKNIKTLRDFDEIYTSRAHGFNDAIDYYTKCSSLQFLPHIKVPALIINALNDTFLSNGCYPVKEAKANEHLFLEMPKYGGHVGFIDKNNVYYNEKRALEFVSNHVR